jgi:MFS family permease
MNTRRAWGVWLTGVLIYMIAVLQRSSFGVAGLTAAKHFGASAGLVSVFVVLQLAVYAGGQLPMGLLLDRYGTRRMLMAGAICMGLGQLLVGLANTVPLAILGRVLVGLGDAMTFNSTIRLVPYWFSSRHVPILTQLTGSMGQLGQVLSAVPFLALLTGSGWRPAFFSAAAVSAAMVVLAFAIVRNAPAGAWRPNRSGSLRTLVETARPVLANPGTQLGFWIHFTTSFSGVVFPLMWGFPFLTAGLGISHHLASAYLSVVALAGIPISPVFGRLTAHYPERRTALALTTIWAQIVFWIVVLLWPGRPPALLLIVLVVAIASGGPGSSIAFDYARTSHPAERVGSATGVTIMGGFIGGLVSILVIGLTLDWLSPGGSYSHGAFCIAMATQLPLFVIGIFGISFSKRKFGRVRTVTPPAAKLATSAGAAAAADHA